MDTYNDILHAVCISLVDTEKWSYMIFRNPQTIEFCPILKNFSPDDIRYLLSKHPDLAKHFPNFQEQLSMDGLAKLFKSQPHFAENFHDWDNLFSTATFDSIEDLLIEQPHFAEYCKDWDRLSPLFHYSYLLSYQPQLIKYCTCVEQLKLEDWSKILSTDPNILNAFTQWDSLTVNQWVRILRREPQLSEYCQAWDKFTPLDWAKLIVRQPQFLEKCPDIITKIDPETWCEMIDENRDLSSQCPYSIEDFSRLSKRTLIGINSPIAKDFHDWDIFDVNDWVEILMDRGSDLIAHCPVINQIESNDWEILLSYLPELIPYVPEKIRSDINIYSEKNIIAYPDLFKTEINKKPLSDETISRLKAMQSPKVYDILDFWHYLSYENWENLVIFHSDKLKESILKDPNKIKRSFLMACL